MKKKRVIIISIIAGSVAILSALGVTIGIVIDNNNKANAYDEGVQDLIDKKYVDAYQIFTALGNYKDSPKKKSYSYELFNIQEGYKNYEKTIDNIVKEEGVSDVNFDTDGGDVLPSRKIDEVSTTNYITERGFKSYMDFDYWRIDEAHYDYDADDVSLTLLAIYYQHEYKISYELNGGSISKDAPLHYTYFDGDISIPYASRDGYTFLGYTVNGGTEVIKDVVIPAHSHIDYELSAVYHANTVHVTFNGNGGTPSMVSGDYIYDHDYSGSFPTASKPYYSFAGWYYNDILVTPEKFNVSENNAELIASYLPTEYSITYNLDGGSFLVDAPDSYNIESPTFTIPYPHKDGYLFTGWTVASEDAVINYKINHGSHEDITLNAHYVSYSETDNIIEDTGLDIHSYKGVVLPSNIVGLTNHAKNDKFNEVTEIGLEAGSCFYYEDHFLMKRVEDDEIELYMPTYAVYKDETVISVPNCHRIGKRAFEPFVNVQIVHLSPLTYYLDERAFINCASLTFIDGGNIITIKDFGFSNCSFLTYYCIKQYHNLAYIGRSVFSHCGCFDNILITDKVKFIDEYAFGETNSITDVTITYASDANIATTAFYHCNNLTSIHVNNSNASKALEIFEPLKDQIQHVELIGGGALYESELRDYVAMTSLTFTDMSFTSIPSEFCRSTNNLNSVTIPSSVTSIETEAFRDSGITSVTFNDASKLTHIATGAFRNTNITTIDLHLARSLKIDDDAFLDCSSLQTIHVHYDATDNLGKVFRRCGAVKDIYIYYDGDEGDSIDIEQEYFSEFRLVENVHFVNTTNKVIDISLGKSCFKNCEFLESISFDSFKLVGLSNYTFENCRSLTFDPAEHVFDYITAFPEGVFYGCESLTGITFNNITSIGRMAFANCLAIGVDAPIYLPSTITSIGYGAFAYNSPSSVINVEDDSITSYTKWDANWNKDFYGVLNFAVAI